MKGPWKEVAVGVLILAAASLLAYMAIRVGTLRVRGAVTYVAYFDDVAGLVENAPISAAGIKIGSVDTLEFVDGRAKVTLRISPDIPVRDDATATVRARSLLGEKYLALTPGESGTPLKEGGEIQTTPTADIDRLMAAVATLAEAADPEDVKGLIHGLNVLLNTTSQDGTTLAQAVADISASVSRLSKKAEKLADESHKIARKVGPALDSVQATSRQLNKVLMALDPAVDQIPDAVKKLDRVLTRLDAILEQNQNLTQESIMAELRRIALEEGIYIRLTKPKSKSKKK